MIDREELLKINSKIKAGHQHQVLASNDKKTNLSKMSNFDNSSNRSQNRKLENASSVDSQKSGRKLHKIETFGVSSETTAQKKLKIK